MEKETVNTDRAYRAAIAYSDGMLTVEESAVALLADLLDMLEQDYNVTEAEALGWRRRANDYRVTGRVREWTS